jgi:murein DD-endopeptidase MepM/ murein hydrolase activator NlpD
VEQRPLEAPAAPRTAAAPPPVAAPPPAPPAPTYRTVTTRTAAGRVIEVEGAARTYRVRKHDSLQEAADRLDVSVSELRELNGLKRHATIHPGQVLKGSRSRAHAYVATQGDTLYAVSRRFDVSPAALAEENGLRRDAGLRPGQRVRLPEGYRDRGALVTSTRVRVDAAGPSAPETEAVVEPPAPTAQAESAPPSSSEPRGPVYRTVTSRSVTGRVVEAEGHAAIYRVRRGDTLTEVADKLGISVEELRDYNRMKKRHSTIHPGQVLKGPRRPGHAYVAEQGDTLFSIGRRFGVSAEALRAENGLRRNAGVRSGQRVRLPEGFRDHGPLTSTVRIAMPQPGATGTWSYPPPTTTAPPPAASSSYPPAYPAPYPPPYPPTTTTTGPRPYAPPAATAPAATPPSTPTPADEQISALGRGRFIWPVQGSILSDFGPKTTGQRNDGVNIQADVGASVHAAAAGDVVYAGDQVPGFGNLVLIKHADGWVTAYGHLSRVTVKMQQKVTQGQEIGLAGATGGVSEPQLHFEVRYAPSALERAKPIDPKLVLPH